MTLMSAQQNACAEMPAAPVPETLIAVSAPQAKRAPTLTTRRQLAEASGRKIGARLELRLHA